MSGIKAFPKLLFFFVSAEFIFFVVCIIFSIFSILLSNFVNFTTCITQGEFLFNINQAHCAEGQVIVD